MRSYPLGKLLLALLVLFVSSHQILWHFALVLFPPALAVSQATSSDKGQRVQPGDRVIGVGKEGSVFAQRHGVDLWTPYRAATWESER